MSRASKRRHQRERAAARSKEQLIAAAAANNPSEGATGGPQRDPTGVTMTHAAYLEGLAIRWHGSQRYPVNTPKKELIAEISARKDVTFPERLLLSVYSGIESDDLRRVGIA